MTTETKAENEDKSPIDEYEWMIRPCEMYKEEYSECTSIRGRFQQYFVYGQTLDCSQWKRDQDNCEKWMDNKDINSAEKVIDSEKVRRYNRLKAHYENNIWEKRKQPPAEWDKPLPDYIAKNYENTYLDIKSKELRGEAPTNPNPLLDRTFCVVM